MENDPAIDSVRRVDLLAPNGSTGLAESKDLLGLMETQFPSQCLSGITTCGGVSTFHFYSNPSRIIHYVRHP